eukprot:c18720_g1_i3.p1 GENE.c18720_g1_i3~~c18720_g1_i3.p1  ORF type:complete len:446 (+),score=76.23 c18720_g1_i3:507-1844(+)
MREELRPLSSFEAQLTLEMAQESDARWACGQPRSVLEGVPFVVADDIDVMGFYTSDGTWRSKRRAQTHSDAVAELRAAGAVVVGKTIIQPLGLGMGGCNPTYGSPRNPYDTNYLATGSSPGAAAVVAMGICPIALVTDASGGGRVSAACCGVVGFKPTYGRVSLFGCLPICPSSTNVMAVARNSTDAAIVYAIMSGPVDSDPRTTLQPSLTLSNFGPGSSVKGLRVARWADWQQHSHPSVLNVFEKAVQTLVRSLEVDLVDVSVKQLDDALSTFLTASACEISQYATKNWSSAELEQQSDALRLHVALGRHITEADQVVLGKCRHRAYEVMTQVFKLCDVFITPTTPRLSERALDASGQPRIDNLDNHVEFCRFTFLSSLLGLPAITLPVGYTQDPNPMPVSLMIMARPWHEVTALRLARCLEKHLIGINPPIHFRNVPPAVAKD